MTSLTKDEVEALLTLANKTIRPGPVPSSGYIGISLSDYPKNPLKPWRVYYKKRDRGFYATLDEAKYVYALLFKLDPPVPPRERRLIVRPLVRQDIKSVKREYSRPVVAADPKVLVLRRENPRLDITHPKFKELLTASIRVDGVVPTSIESRFAGVSWSKSKELWKATYMSKTIGYYTSELSAATDYAKVRAEYLNSKGRSSYRGVSWHKKTGKWVATRKGVFLGYFVEAFDAHLAYEAANETTWKDRRVQYTKEELARQELLRGVQLNESNITGGNNDD